MIQKLIDNTIPSIRIRGLTKTEIIYLHRRLKSFNRTSAKRNGILEVKATLDIDNNLNIRIYDQRKNFDSKNPIRIGGTYLHYVNAYYSKILNNQIKK